MVVVHSSASCTSVLPYEYMPIPYICLFTLVCNGFFSWRTFENCAPAGACVNLLGRELKLELQLADALVACMADDATEADTAEVTITFVRRALKADGWKVRVSGSMARGCELWGDQAFQVPNQYLVVCTL